ncbi:MAG: FAD:protein FMN transferase [Mizugakiibacter sp.]|uniref:FAD:protein FMN transferase n=1 Tax=Mizugakiibacter sp. TaxID=1972610 RepID=UPI0031C1BA77|nr:FAD:protein FMN transferase [Xanthomonadaceae bacterium]
MDEKSLWTRRRLLKAAAGAVLAGGALAAGGWSLLRLGRNLYQVRRERTLMQTSVSVTALADDVEAAHRGIEAAFAAMVAATATLTRFDARSPLARLNREGRLDDPPPMLRAVLARAHEIAERSEGDFDATVAPVLDYYYAQPRPIVLSAADRGAVAARERVVGFRHVEMDAAGIRFLRSGVALTLDGIAKGYVVDQGIAALRRAGIEDALIDAGGEVRAIAGADPERRWNVGIVDPQRSGRIAAVVELRNAALSTSGNYEVYFSADRRLFHIIDPHTGYSPDRYSSVTVMGALSMDTDAASVAAFSMELPRLAAFADGLDQQWLAFSWDGATRWHSRDLPLVSGEARAFG